MTRFCQVMNFCKRRALPTLILLFFGLPVIGQQATISAPLTADAVIQRVVLGNPFRLKLSP